ncbi:DUF1643 domain-containing protein [Microbulbifer sp. M83]|uniref:DUF1643 domain-containing protein n=1 Tax=Microbulbifer sp. M83 TaxID=3118246 RepID=UPI002FE0DED6
MYDLYTSNDDDTARYILGKSGAKKLFVIGLNPSTANKEKSDTTVAKVENVAKSNSFDGFIMANLYPLRSTDPNGLPCEADQGYFRDNIDYISKLASLEENPVFWAAWGGDIDLRSYLSDSFKALNAVVKRVNGKWVNYGDLRKDGHPRHPSRLSYAWQFFEFDSDSYAQRFA